MSLKREIPAERAQALKQMLRGPAERQRAAGKRAGRDWIIDDKNIDEDVLAALDSLRDDEQGNDAAHVTEQLFPDADEDWAEAFWERMSGTNKPIKAFVEGFVCGALRALDEVEA